MQQWQRFRTFFLFCSWALSWPISTQFDIQNPLSSEALIRRCRNTFHLLFNSTTFDHYVVSFTFYRQLFFWFLYHWYEKENFITRQCTTFELLPFYQILHFISVQGWDHLLPNMKNVFNDNILSLLSVKAQNYFVVTKTNISFPYHMISEIIYKRQIDK